MSAAYGFAAMRGFPRISELFDMHANASTPVAGSRLDRGRNCDTEAGKSFYDVAPTVRWNRERYACAQLGLVPGQRAFGQCVASLDGAFLPTRTELRLNYRLSLLKSRGP